MEQNDRSHAYNYCKRRIMPRLNFKWDIDLNTVLMAATLIGGAAVLGHRVSIAETAIQRLDARIEINERAHAATHEKLAQLINDTSRQLAVLAERITYTTRN